MATSAVLHPPNANFLPSRCFGIVAEKPAQRLTAACRISTCLSFATTSPGLNRLHDAGISRRELCAPLVFTRKKEHPTIVGAHNDSGWCSSGNKLSDSFPVLDCLASSDCHIAPRSLLFLGWHLGWDTNFSLRVVFGSMRPREGSRLVLHE